MNKEALFKLSKDDLKQAIKDVHKKGACIACKGCTGCTDCEYCIGCTNCTRCTCCTDCEYCICCIDCTGCTNCTDCTDCIGCAAQYYKRYMVLNVQLTKEEYETVKKNMGL